MVLEAGVAGWPYGSRLTLLNLLSA